MAPKLRPSGIGSGIDKDRPDYTVVTGEWEVGRIYETRGSGRLAPNRSRRLHDAGIAPRKLAQDAQP